MFMLVLLCVLQTLSSDVVHGFMVTSSKDIERFVTLDLTTNLQAYIKHEELRLRVITNDSRHEEEVPLVQKKLKEFKSIHKDLQNNKTSTKAPAKTAIDNHPTSVFAAFRNFYHTWQHKLSNKTAYGKRLHEFLKRNHQVPFPTQEDLFRAGAVIAYLQRAYNISKADIIQGRIKGHQGTPLNAADCYLIGKVSAKSKLVEESVEWMTMALNSIDLSSPKVMKDAIFNVTDAMVILAKGLVTMERKEEALAILEKATGIDPENMGIQSLYLKHRSGRKVKGLPNVEIQSHKKHFFEICGNLSAGHDIGDRRYPEQRLRCRYRAYGKTPYWRFREEIMSRHPYISVIHDFMGDGSIKALLNVSQGKAFKEEPLPGGVTGILWQSKTRVISDFFDPVIGEVSKRVSYVTGLGVRQMRGRISLGEPIHIIDFGPGGTLMPHRDVSKKYDHFYVGNSVRPRHATFHLYLSDTKEGGYLVFPELNLAITPAKGKAIFVHNFTPNDMPEPRLLVGMCPLLMGKNLVLQKGIFTSGLDENVMCGRTPRSTHFSVEKARQCVAGPCGASNFYNFYN